MAHTPGSAHSGHLHAGVSSPFIRQASPTCIRQQAGAKIRTLSRSIRKRLRVSTSHRLAADLEPATSQQSFPTGPHWAGPQSALQWARWPCQTVLTQQHARLNEVARQERKGEILLGTQLDITPTDVNINQDKVR